MDALGKFEEHSRSQSCSRLLPRATLTLPSCSPNFLRASITRYTHAKHEPILYLNASNVPDRPCQSLPNVKPIILFNRDNAEPFE